MGQSTEELSSQIAGTRENLAADLDALQDRVSPSAIVERRKAAARGRVRSVRNKVMGTARGARDSAGSSTSGVADGAKGAVGSVTDTVEGSPLAAGLVAFGAGMVISAMLPASEAETRAANQLMETAKEQGQPLVEEARSVGSEVGQHLKGSATEATQEVKSSAQDSVRRLQEEGSTAVGAVRSEAQDAGSREGQ
jgi:ElaB/YqjD/DUF883 family membrane-anchored ribosome-binding protein